MKNLHLILLTLFTGTLFSQAPALIPYQAVARDAGGQPLANASLTARFTLHDLTATGASVWQELQTVSTSALGLFTAQLGSVSPLTSVNWGNGAKFMQVEIDAGNGFVDIGTQQMLSVPYALHSGEAGNALNAQNAQNGISAVSTVGDTLYLANGTFLIVPGISISNSGAVSGCTDNTACNYNSAATENDGICYYVGGACNDNNPATLNDAFNANCVCAGGAGVSGTAHSCGLQYVHNPSLTYGTMTDQEGNAYKTIVIGTQLWMAENLKTSTYRNGDVIPTNLDNSQWSSTTSGAWAYYNNNASYACPYGKLYNWYAVNDARNLCPLGWHVPSDAEWIVLTSYLSGVIDIGGQMKTTGIINSGTGLWISPNTGATNGTGFSGLPGGKRVSNGVYGDMAEDGYWWSGTQDVSNNAWIRSLRYNYTDVNRVYYSTHYGFSVRCLRD